MSVTTKARLRQMGRVTIAVGFLVAVTFPLWSEDEGLLRLFTIAFIWSGFAVSWTLFSGYSGYLSFGHAIFFGVGAFTSVLLLINHDITPWAGMVIGGLVAALVAVLIGLVTLARLSGIYFGLTMLTFPMAMAPVMLWLGYIEISVPFRPNEPWYYMSFRGMFEYYYIALALLVLATAVSWWIKRGQMGRYLQAINDNEKAAKHLGINTEKYKMISFTISAFLSGMLGTVYTQTQFVLTPDTVFGLNAISQPVILAVAGGMNTVFGPIVSGMTLYPFSNYLRRTLSGEFPGIDNLMYGAVLVLVIIYLPKGILPSFRNLLYEHLTPAEEYAEAEREGGPEDDAEAPSGTLTGKE